MSKSGWKKRLAAGVVMAILASGSVFAWRQLTPAGLSDSFAVGNGRIEATEIDIATKTAGRITESLVNDGDVVEAGQVLARMDTQTLEAELRQAQAQSGRHSRPRPRLPPSWPNARARRLRPLPSWPSARVRRPPPPPSWPNARANWHWQTRN